MVALLDYSSNILRVGGSLESERVAKFDSFFYDAVNESSTAGQDDAYSTLMNREEKVLQAINKIANEYVDGNEKRGTSKDNFLSLSVADVAVQMVDLLRVSFVSILQGRGVEAIAQVVIDPNAQIFTGLWIVILSLLLWSVSI